MPGTNPPRNHGLPKGVMLNAYPDSIGQKLSDTVALLKRPEFEGVFSLFYILPTFFNSDLDRGFSVIDYDINEELVSLDDLVELRKQNIGLKFDLVLNHLSVGSHQFQDMLKSGDASPYKDFFINWNEFWQSKGELSEEGHIVPDEEYLEKLFVRKPGLPILNVRFPDGSEHPYWNTFYQEVNYHELVSEDLDQLNGITEEEKKRVLDGVNSAIREGRPVGETDLGTASRYKQRVIDLVEGKRTYLGQMDLNAESEKIWKFYDETLKRLSEYGAKLIRLDALAYLHKEPGETNFFNKPGTWDYLSRLRELADKHGLTLLPEVHSEYGKGLHTEIAGEDFIIYDFFFPGLVIDALDRGTKHFLVHWIREMQEKGIETVNMLGCHDGIPILDLKGSPGGEIALMNQEDIDGIVDRVMERGGRVKDLYGPDGKKIAYYQVNATFFSALGEDEQKLRLARAIQMFMPGIPQVWYLDLFAGKNDYAAADKGGTGGHKEINRTTLYLEDIERGLKRDVVLDQLDLMRMRTKSPAFDGHLSVEESDDHELQMTWENGDARATLKADLSNHSFTVRYTDENGQQRDLSYS